MSSSVPNLPGVPALFNNIPVSLPTLLLTDLISPSEFSQSPAWGVFLGGQPVVSFDTFLGIDFRQGWAISDYPVENGAFESYDKVDMPFDVRVRFAAGGSAENRQALLETVTVISETLDFYDVVTPEVIYQNCNVQHIDYRRTNTNGVGMITVEMWLLEIRVVPKRGSDVIFPSSADPFNEGTTQTVLPTLLQNAILALVR